MKNLIAIFAAMLSIANAFCQEKVSEAPFWFFSPPKGECVGVSFPLSNRDAAKRQAVCMALLSYMVQHDMNERDDAYTLRRTTKGYGTVTDAATATSVKVYTSLILSLSASYTVAKVAENKYGEVFVSINVGSSSIGYRDRGVALSDTMKFACSEGLQSASENNELASASFSSELAFRLASPAFGSLFSVEQKTAYGRGVSASNKTSLTAELPEQGVEFSQAWDAARTTYRYTPTAPPIPHAPWRWSVSVDEHCSLGGAYLRVLLSMMQEASEMNAASDPQNPYSAYENLQSAERRTGTPIEKVSIRKTKDIDKTFLVINE
jgi:hypothetical protein